MVHDPKRKNYYCLGSYRRNLHDKSSRITGQCHSRSTIIGAKIGQFMVNLKLPGGRIRGEIGVKPPPGSFVNLVK